MVIGGGELGVTGNNTYRGTTVVSQGVLTLGNDGALGTAVTSQVQTITLGAASAALPNPTTFTLSFGGFTTPVIRYTGLPLGVNGDVAAIQNALNALSIRSAASAGRCRCPRTPATMYSPSPLAGP